MSESMDLTPNISVRRGIAFGRPALTHRCITTRTIYERWMAGERPDEIRADYGISPYELHEAIAFEAGRRWADSQRAEWNKGTQTLPKEGSQTGGDDGD